jgi:hypothetical protein
MRRPHWYESVAPAGGRKGVALPGCWTLIVMNQQEYRVWPRPFSHVDANRGGVRHTRFSSAVDPLWVDVAVG